jgi:hypothetical protein
VPRDIQSIPITFSNTGIVLKSSPDEIPITAYKALINVQTDRENTVSVRHGFARLNNGLPSPPYAFYFLKDQNGRQWRYAITGNQLYVAPVLNPGNPAIWPLILGNDFGAVVGGSGLSAGVDPRPFWTTYSLSGYEMKPYMFMADGTQFLKHSGGLGNATRIGIPKPVNPITSITLEPATLVDIELFENYLDWTVDNSIVAQVSPGEVGDGISIKITGDKTVGGAYKSITVGGYPTIIDLDVLDVDGIIEMWMQFPDDTSALNCSEIVVTFGLSTTIGDTGFQTRFEKSVSPSAFEAASQVGSTGRTETYDTAVPGSGDSLAYRRVGDEEYIDPGDYNQVNQFNTGQPTEMRPGTGIWNRIRVKKSEFTRAGESALTNPLLNWDTVAAIRIDIKNIDSAIGSKDCTIYFDDFTYLRTGRLIGIDYQWVYTYYNSLTGIESDYADPIGVPYPGAEYDQYRLTFPACPAITPPLADPDTIRIYRLGGTLAQYQLVEEVAYTPGIVPPDYIDDKADSILGIVLETDNQLPPDNVKGVVLYDDRLFTWGGSVTPITGPAVLEPPNRLRFSKGVRIEEFPVDNFLYVGTGAEEIQNCIEYDGELFVFTLTRVYRVIGSNGVYRALSTSVNQGLKSPHALAKGIRSIYMYAYDGIYEFPSGRKISEVINPIFFGQTTNEIPPVAAGREYQTAMAFWNSKVYFSYPRTSDPDITNDGILVWDTIYERWHFYLYGAQDLFMEPENNILVGGNLTQWDSIVAGLPSNFHYSGAWPMVLESGFADQCQPPDNFRGIFWVVDTKDYDLGMPDQEKRFFDFVVDADTQGEQLNIEVALDIPNSDTTALLPPYESIGIVQTIGRQRTVLPTPLGEGNSVLAVRVALRILAQTHPSATASTRLFKVTHRILPEPLRHRTFVTDWSDYGSPGPKYWRELWVELDTFGQALDSIEVQTDQGIGQVISPVPAVTGQTRLFFGLLPDIRGTLARLKFVPRGGNEVKVYTHSFQFIPEPPLVNAFQTPWSNEGWPYPKLWKEVILDVDTNLTPTDFNFWVDNKIVDTFSVKTNGRERVTHSLPKDIFGKLGRITVNEPMFDPTCCTIQGIRPYNTEFVTDKEPADVTFSDSYDQLFSYDRLKVIRKFWVAMKNPDCDVTMQIYVDEVLKTTKIIPQDQRATGFSKRRIDVESAIKGRLIRIFFSGVFPFQLYWERSEWEIKDCNAEDGYRRERMIPPQTM